ncbi:MAG: MAPEG family protein [Hyphomicrobiaceae bacterium]|nr:MAPEG family protein [Hyphomicrobiaceae bacterium]
MSNFDILLPVFAQVALTFVLMFSMAFSRTSALKRKDVRMADIALGQSNWPARTMQISNAFGNQFEMPVLFYVVVALAIVTGQVSLPLVVLAWAFVVFRALHAYIHTSSNYVPNRFYAFAGSVFSVLAMWVVFAAHVIMAAGAAS